MRVRREDSTEKSGVGQWQWQGETPETVSLPPLGLVLLSGPPASTGETS